METTLNGSVYGIPLLVFAAFQLMFAIITPALISGAIADRAKFSTWLIFVVLWVTIVYFPVAHWVFDFGDKNGDGAGWLAAKGVLDFAGGTAVHVKAGAAGLALAIVLGKRVGWRRDPMRPHSLPLVMLGAGLLWFGWFGFNAGSALGANATAATAFMTTNTAAAAAMLSWLAVEKLKSGHATTLGGASGAVAGLVAITPCAGFVNPMAALAIGLIAGVLCFLACQLKFKFGFDDSLDVIAVHLVGGITGSILLGVFANEAFGGLIGGGGSSLLGKQALAVGATIVYSGVVSFILAKIVDKTIGLRVAEDDEASGLDLSQHAESAYAAGEFGSMGRVG
ncbi:MAG: ammonium transporter, Amt family [Actinomycetota bacterium]|nr:ammonium transporter, Amt family [Actinomycetota bacterium]